MRSLFAAACTFAILTPIAASAQISKSEYPERVDLTELSSNDVLPSDFRGRITYRGFYRGKAYVPQVGMEVMGGDYILVMEFNGNRVSGSLTTRNGVPGARRGLLPGRFTGTRNGVVCTLTWNDGSDSAAYCGRSEYRAGANKTQFDGVRLGFAATIPADELVDYVVRDQQNAIADAERKRLAAIEAEQARQKAERERKRIAAMPLAGTTYTRLLDQAISTDSGSWRWNQYDAGSANNVRIATGTAANGTLRGEYRFNGGASGWVEAQVSGGKITCLHYWDTGSCAPIRTAANTSNNNGTDGYRVTCRKVWHSGGPNPNQQYQTTECY